MSLRLYGAFTKVTAQDDGTLHVEGIASTESVDSQGEVVKASAMAAALPAYMKFGNVREMHQAIAAGKALACGVDDQGVTHITAHVVDPASVKKVQAGVLQGFSIGGKVLKRNAENAKTIEEISLTEISLVDRPANPDALIQLVKFDAPVAEAPAAVAEAAPPAPPAPLKKGMFTVSWAAELLGSISALASDTQWEADFEGDSSPIPARIKALCTEFAAILRDLVAEETAELVGEAAEAEALEMASKPGALKKSERLAGIARAFVASAKGEPAEVAKGGKKFSKATSDALASIHKCVKDAHDQLGALGYEQKDDDSAEMAAQVGEMQKAATDALAKAAAAETARDEAEKAAGLAGDALKKVLAEKDALAKQLADANVELQRKGSLRAVPVSKSGDAPTGDETAVPADPHSLIKSIHASGGRRLG